MSIARPSPLRLAGTLHTCIRRRNFSKSTLLHDDKPPPKSQFPPRTAQPQTSMSETPKQDILKHIEGVLSGKHLAFGRNQGVSSPSSYHSDIFQPIDMSEE